MSSRAALRRLSSVEVDPGASHQREFHAVALRREFGFRLGKTQGRALAVYCPSDGDMVCDDTVYTLYDARKPPRSEHHLYPATSLFLDHASAGDLLAIFRAGVRDDLCMVVAERNGSMESDLLITYFPTGVPTLERWAFSNFASPLLPRSADLQALVDLARSLGYALS